MRGGTWRRLGLVVIPAAVLGEPLPGPWLAVPLYGQAAPVDTTGLGTGPHARMEMLLERTIFRVDVLILEVRLGSAATVRLDSLLAGRGGAGRSARDERTARGTRGIAIADSIAAIALDARDALARIEFRRNVGLNRFLDGMRDNLRAATRAGVLTPASYRDIVADLRGWYDFLARRGIRSGDRMLQRIRGDSLRTVYVDPGGEVLLDQLDVGPERRLAVLGGYFAPDSDFREGLVESLLEVD